MIRTCANPPAEEHPFEPCHEADGGDIPGHNFTCALLCVTCGLPREKHQLKLREGGKT
jgi:hypothetical protein